jgi:hypothetical protein
VNRLNGIGVVRAANVTLADGPLLEAPLLGADGKLELWERKDLQVH